MGSKNLRNERRLKKMLDKMKKVHSEFSRDMTREHYEKEIEKNKKPKSETDVSPSGGRTPFNSSIDWDDNNQRVWVCQVYTKFLSSYPHRFGET